MRIAMTSSETNSQKDWLSLPPNIPKQKSNNNSVHRWNNSVHRWTWITVARCRVVPSSSASSSSVNQRELPKVLGSISKYLRMQWPTTSLQLRFKLFPSAEEGEFSSGSQSYGFQSEPGRRRSAMRKSMTRRRSSTRPSSKSARHRGPTSGSCSTRIGVMARSSGTTIATPAPHRRNARMSLVLSGKERGEERRGALPSLETGSGAAVEKTPKPLPPHARIVQPRRSAPLAYGGKGGVGV